MSVSPAPLSLIFDLDGTLVDSAPDIHATANRALAEAGLPPLGFQAVRDMIGGGVPHLIGALLEASGEAAEGPRRPAMEKAFATTYKDALALTRTFPGVVETLSSLRDAGHPLGLCTNKPEAAARAVLAHFSLSGLFSAVVAGDSLPVRKPDPAPLFEARRQLGGRPVLYVGDGETDAETARRAGLPFVLFTEGYRKTPAEALNPVEIFSDYRDLPAIVTKYLSRCA